MSCRGMQLSEPEAVEWHEDASDASTRAGTAADPVLHAENLRLRRRNQTLETIAYVLAHDLRSPLRAIDGFSRALVEDLGESLPTPAARDLCEIRSGVERMQAMIAQWLTFIRDGECGVRHERVNLSMLASSVVSELNAAEPQRAVVVYIEPDLHVQGDAVLLRQLLQNLLGNAWKFTMNQDERAVITFGARSEAGSITYFVQDNGPGFDAADAHKMFAPFTRLDQASEIDGNGVGLAIARSIIDAHHGRIWAEGGQPGAGARFCFSLPKALLDRPASKPVVA